MSVTRFRDEIWREIPGFPNYKCSNNGRVFSHNTGKYLTQHLDNNGRLRVSLANKGKKKIYNMHILVASIFLESFMPGGQIVHLDGDYTNNHISNLEHRVHDREPRVGYTPSRGRPVTVVEWDRTYDNAIAVAEALDTDYSSIYRCLRGAKNHHLGLTFEYAD